MVNATCSHEHIHVPLEGPSFYDVFFIEHSFPHQPPNSTSTMSLFPPAPKPKSLLGYHRILSPTAGVRVSPLCLGAMNFGDA